MSDRPDDHSDQARNYLIRHVSHEMRAPLAAIVSILQAVMDSATHLSDEHRRMLGRARHRAAALVTLVDDLRKYWRLQSSPQPNIVRLEMDKLVSSTAELFRQQASAAGIDLRCQCDQAQLDGDEELLREVVTNLLANAIQYTPSGGRIEVRLLRRPGRLSLKVSDTGIGISPQAREHLFEEFYRAPEAKAVFPEGTGMGLSIVRRIVQMHGGTVRALRRRGGGTVMEISFPLRTKTTRKR